MYYVIMVGRPAELAKQIDLGVISSCGPDSPLSYTSELYCLLEDLAL